MAAKIIPFRARSPDSPMDRPAPLGPPLILILPVVRVERAPKPWQAACDRLDRFLGGVDDGKEPA